MWPLLRGYYYYTNIAALSPSDGPVDPSVYLRPGGEDDYRRPGGTFTYLRP